MDKKILGTVNSPDDVKKLDESQLNILCEEIRKEIIDTVAKNGGHLASNLGTVELTVALHRAFSSPKDAIIFDVGHQSYTHKLLTGRFDKFSTIRTEGGLSGFMRPSESEHDPFVTGHSSNSISAAYGIYRAKKISGEEGTAVAVIGDGAFTGGMAYEGLNNAGSMRGNFIIVLNDNKMSISRNVGSMSRAITRLRNRPRYHNFKFAVSRILAKIPFIGNHINNFIYNVKEFFKHIFYNSSIFESFGYNYLGPVDGHNIKEMEGLFKIAEKYNKPSVIHVITTKGKGYSYAESKPKNYHGVSPFDIETGCTPSGKATFSDIAGKTLCEIAKENEKVCAVTAAMTMGTGLTDFSTTYRNRFFDVGIAEQHAVTFSAGLAKGGMIPFFAVYSSFLQRGYDQIIHDCAIQNLPVKFLIDRAGIVGEDGESHQGVFDVSYLTSIPNMNVYSPCYFSELEEKIRLVSTDKELCAVRYPRGCELGNCNLDFSDDYTLIDNSKDIVIVTYGRIFSNVLEVSKDENVSVVKLNKIYPINKELPDILREYKRVIFIEEGIKKGGIGESLCVALNENGFVGKYEIRAIDGEFVPQASVTSSLKHYGFDIDSIKELLRNNNAR